MYLGRIACENKVGKWNSECVLLEGNFESSLGESVKLNVRDLPWLSIFPGQIVGVVGSNPSGREIRASKMLFVCRLKRLSLPMILFLPFHFYFSFELVRFCLNPYDLDLFFSLLFLLD